MNGSVGKKGPDFISGAAQAPSLEYRTMDKSTWGPGPWQDEPDKCQWTDTATGLPCMIKRNSMGALCGYVGVSEGHPSFEVGYDDVAVDVHGGLTYAEFCDDDDAVSIEHRICHIPEPGAPDRVWWLGFDCAHAFDLSPQYYSRSRDERPMRDEVYRDIAYVTNEVEKLAAQLSKCEPENNQDTQS